MLIKIKNLNLRTIIGFQEWERDKPQDVVVNLTIEVDNETATETDEVNDTVDYKSIKYNIIQQAEQTRFFLLEKLAGFIADLVLEDAKIKQVTVEIDKPHALRFAESVSVTLTRQRKS